MSATRSLSGASNNPSSYCKYEFALSHLRLLNKAFLGLSHNIVNYHYHVAKHYHYCQSYGMHALWQLCHQRNVHCLTRYTIKNV